MPAERNAKKRWRAGFGAPDALSVVIPAVSSPHSAGGNPATRTLAIVKQIAALLLLSIATEVSAQPVDEDVAHRADRQQTEALNRRVADDIARRNRANANGQDSYEAATARYARQLQEWRRRVEACRAGYYDACE
ncbi:hypothetical protein [Sphingomonas sp. MMS24-J13]|uniref:hypothetical protein n=1 Tax=Sphingomonas sp. MMS24-J13 TaxID=3238686 RepID=UPI00384A62A8